MRIIILSGRSGSGKTIVLHALEDLGFYCIDNLPVALLTELESQLSESHASVAISIDARNLPSDLSHFKTVVESFKEKGNSCEILYLDADEKTLLKRFSETRRKHPLTNEQTSLKEAIQQEHLLLTPIASLADLSLDTSTLTHQALKNLIRERVSTFASPTIQLLIQSFGFKHGLPVEADFIFDLRCLPNPYWEAALKSQTGLDKEVIHFLNSKPEVYQMLEDIQGFLEKWIPRFEADNRSYMTIALGCTGGRHRSVYLAENLASKLRDNIPDLQLRHRDL